MAEKLTKKNLEDYLVEIYPPYVILHALCKQFELNLQRIQKAHDEKIAPKPEKQSVKKKKEFRKPPPR